MNDRLEFYVPGQPFDGGTYHYTECGLDNVFLLNGFSEENDPDYGRLVSFKSVDDLHLAIGLHLIECKRSLASKEFRFLRKQMGMTQAELAKDFGVDSQTIANYEKGATPIPKTTDGYLRVQLLLRIIPEDMRAEVLKEIAGFQKAKRVQSKRANRKQIVRFWEETSASTQHC